MPARLIFLIGQEPTPVKLADYCGACSRQGKKPAFTVASLYGWRLLVNMHLTRIMQRWNTFILHWICAGLFLTGMKQWWFPVIGAITTGEAQNLTLFTIMNFTKKKITAKERIPIC